VDGLLHHMTLPLSAARAQAVLFTNQAKAVLHLDMPLPKDQHCLGSGVCLQVYVCLQRRVVTVMTGCSGACKCACSWQHYLAREGPGCQGSHSSHSVVEQGGQHLH
jgi:hypothetical protein